MKIVLPARVEIVNSRNNCNSDYDYQYGLVFVIKTKTDVEAVGNLINGLHSGDSLELYAFDDFGNEIPLIFPEGKINKIYIKRIHSYSIQDKTLLETQVVDARAWIPEEFKRLFPNRIDNINTEVNKILFCHSYGYDEFAWYLTFWGNKLISIANGLPELSSALVEMPDDVIYFVAGIPTSEVPKDSIQDFLYNCSGRMRICFSSRGYNRVVIGKDYFRHNSTEFYPDTYNHLISFRNFYSGLTIGSKANKLRIFDTQLFKLIHDDVANNPFQRLCHLDVNYSYKQLGVGISDSCKGLYLNLEQVEQEYCSNSPYYKFKFTEEEILALRNQKSDTIYNTPAAAIDFTKHLAKKKQAVKLTSVANNKFCIMSKTSTKLKTEELTYKTRMFNNIHSHFLSLCYPIVLHSDLICPPDYYNGCYNLTDFVTNIRYVRCDRQTMESVLGENKPLCIFTEEHKQTLKLRMTDFIKGYLCRELASSTIGSPSVITKYFIEPDASKRFSYQYDFCWLYGFDKTDTHNQYRSPMHVGASPRSLMDGFNSETQSISANYFLHLLREPNIPFAEWSFPSTYRYRGYNFKEGNDELERKRQYRHAMSDFYASNCIPNAAIEDDISKRMGDLEIRPFEYDNNHIKYNEIITLADDSLLILSEGYKCKDYASLFAWWMTVLPMLQTKVVNDSTLTSSERMFVMFMLKVNDFIITNLTTRIDDLLE